MARIKINSGGPTEFEIDALALEVITRLGLTRMQTYIGGGEASQIVLARVRAAKALIDYCARAIKREGDSR